MFIFEKAPFASCHASTVVETEPGQFVAAWFGGMAEGRSDVKIWWARFDGLKWSPPEVAAEEPNFPCWNPVLFKSRSGRHFLFYKAGPNPMSWSGFVRRSGDGTSWSAADILPAGILGPIKNKPIQLSDGTILSPTSVESHRAWACWIEKSTDDGETWRRFGPITVPGQPYGIIQPTLFERTDKCVVALMRSRNLKRICQAESTDGGETWTPAKPIGLPHPGSGIDLVGARSGNVYLAYNHTETSRSPLNLGLSKDEGKTWKMVETLEEEPGEFSYPAIIQGHDERLHITYTWKRRHINYLALDPPT